MVQHDGSEQRCARNREHFPSLKGQTPVSDGSRFANAIKIHFDAAEACFANIAMIAAAMSSQTKNSMPELGVINQVFVSEFE